MAPSSSFATFAPVPRPRNILPIALLVLAAGLAGCGGGGDEETTAAPVETTEETALSKDELLSQGDAICAEVNAAVGTLANTDAEGNAELVAQEADLYSGMVDRLKDLGEPSEAVGYSDFVAAADQLEQAESDAQLAAERGEEAGLTEAEESASTALGSFQVAADEYGFEDCSEAPSAPTPLTPGSEAGGEEVEGEAEEVAPEEVEEAAPEEVEEAAPEEEAGGGAGVGGGTGGGAPEESGGGGSGGIGPG